MLDIRYTPGERAASPADFPDVDRRTVEAADGVTLHYSVYGSGTTTVVFIHGLACEQEFWRYQTHSTSGQFQVVCLDLAGHGRSRFAGARRDWSMRAYGADVERVADAVDARNVILIGHAMGGAVAVEAALRMRERCRLIIGVETFTDAALYARRLPAEIAARCAALSSDFPRAIEALVERSAAPGTDRVISAWIALMMGRTDAGAARSILAELLAWDIRDRWTALPCPVETINAAALAHAATDLLLPRLITHRMHYVGHFPMLEDPAKFSATVRSILARHRVR